jgi:hypothetical protein
VLPVLAGQRGFQGITVLYWAAVLESKRVRPWVLKFVGERIELGGHRQRSPNSAAGPRKAALTIFTALTRARGAWR